MDWNESDFAFTAFEHLLKNIADNMQKMWREQRGDRQSEEMTRLPRRKISSSTAKVILNLFVAVVLEGFASSEDDERQKKDDRQEIIDQFEDSQKILESL